MSTNRPLRSLNPNAALGSQQQHTQQPQQQKPYAFVRLIRRRHRGTKNESSSIFETMPDERLSPSTEDQRREVRRAVCCQSFVPASAPYFNQQNNTNKKKDLERNMFTADRVPRSCSWLSRDGDNERRANQRRAEGEAGRERRRIARAQTDAADGGGGGGGGSGGGGGDGGGGGGGGSAAAVVLCWSRLCRFVYTTNST